MIGDSGRILITGGSGFLGRGILRRATREGWDNDVIVYSRDEYKQAQCRKKYPRARYVLGDIRDSERLRLTLLGVDTVIHTAAMKYVPEGETNVSECIGVNIGGTQSVMKAALEAGVGKLVCISTDKAVEPVNVYGMTKAVVERLVGEFDNYGVVKTTAVRYGNVVGSTGSVVPEMKEAAAKYGCVQLTDPTMTRYWLSVDQAIDMIELALDDDVAGGDVYVPDAPALDLTGLVSAIAPDARQEIVGLRPGEKKHETLVSTQEMQRATCLAGGPFGQYCVLRPPFRRGGWKNPPLVSWTSDKAEILTAAIFNSMVADAATV